MIPPFFFKSAAGSNCLSFSRLQEQRHKMECHTREPRSWTSLTNTCRQFLMETKEYVTREIATAVTAGPPDIFRLSPTELLKRTPFSLLPCSSLATTSSFRQMGHNRPSALFYRRGVCSLCATHTGLHQRQGVGG